MKSALPFDKQDMRLLRIPGIFLLLGLAVAAVLYFGSGFVNQQAESGLAQAQARYEQASTSVREISDEEATIIRYIDRYRDIESDGIVGEGDRLAMIEKIGQLRERYNLYPIQVDIGEQTSLPLVYDPLDLNPGDPVNLDISAISLSYSLVHEGDLTRFLDALVDESGLLLPQSCALRVDDVSALDFTQVGPNLSADCSVIWYTFDLNPPEVIYEY